MKLIPYLYHGPQSSVTVRIIGSNKEEQELEVVLYPGREVSLPEKHDYTEALLAQKLLTLPPTTAKLVKADVKAKEQKDDGR
ncbi:hypothetical protein I2494_19920 [Budviciaceae bacterium BWR-B9]|uniref:Uncharacterized protein n=1 Tax=Limnobaculum allomyrinae TaxID=2791986 RepID=A0ABS1IW76_9GAMM|nr:MULTISPECIES: hypothetical protein [Limnobaculum]MBK5145939.1 hypothetical protein [Limnobaculum allomyrinae]MBV7694006.1 hypothetical protein [Limnobaculum sp. M2-1]